MANNVEQTQVQQVAAMYGADWNRWWTLLQKFGPVLQQIIVILLQENQNMPVLAQAGGNQVEVSELQPVAAQCNCDPNELHTLLSSVSPATARLIMAFLTNQGLNQTAN